MAYTDSKLGWIGMGRMGYAMAERLAKGGANLTVWNRTRAKAEPLAAAGAKVASRLVDLATCDVVFVMVSTLDDVAEVVTGPNGLLSGSQAPKLVVECSSISLEGSAELRASLAARGVEMLAAPVSGNAKVIKAGRLSFVCSGPRPAFDTALPFLRMIAPAASYVGEGELSRIVKICHNVFLGVVTQSLAEITVLAQKAGVPRHAFLEFMNQSVMGSVF
jgi:3-hydroxyisobutyrate dehydrogenase